MNKLGSNVSSSDQSSDNGTYARHVRVAKPGPDAVAPSPSSPSRGRSRHQCQHTGRQEMQPRHLVQKNSILTGLGLRGLDIPSGNNYRAPTSLGVVDTPDVSRNQDQG